MGHPNGATAWWTEKYYDRICAGWSTLEWLRIWEAGPEEPLISDASPAEQLHTEGMFRYRAAHGFGDSRPS